MMISYEPLFKTMKNKYITAYMLIDKMGFSRSTYYNSIKKGKHLNTSTLSQLCDLLDCRIEDIVEHISEKK